MIIKWSFIFLLVVAAALSGCVGGNSIVGTYRGNSSFINATLNVYADNTFTVVTGETVSGVYRKESDNYVFSTLTGSFILKRNKDGNLVFPDHEDVDVFIKVK
jgi:hypothetical protein